MDYAAPNFDIFEVCCEHGFADSVNVGNGGIPTDKWGDASLEEGIF